MDTEIINMLFRPNGKEVFLRFSNTGGKSWIIPESQIKTALCLYQPTGRKGRLLRHFFAWANAVPLLRNLAGIEAFSGAQDAHFSKVMKDIFKTARLSYSLFSGTPSRHQKITLQLFDRSNILGYCKVTSSEEISALFAREEEVLRVLKEKGITHIPV